MNKAINILFCLLLLLINASDQLVFAQQKKTPKRPLLLQTKEDLLNWKRMREFIGDKKWDTKEEWDFLVRSRRRIGPIIPRTPMKKSIKKEKQTKSPQELQKDSTSIRDSATVYSVPFEEMGTIVGLDKSECLQLLSSSAISNLRNGAPCG